MKQIFTIILLVISIFMFNNCKSVQPKEKQEQILKETNNSSTNYWVKHSGSRLNIINDADFSESIGLDSLMNIPNLYAMGPIKGLKGEITVYDGQTSLATLENNQPKFSSFPDNTSAIFMVYGSVAKWVEIPIEETLSGLDEVEVFVKKQLIYNGLDVEKPFPFRIEGKVDSLHYHIIYKKNNVPHNQVEHQKAKQRYKVFTEDVKIVGFWADASGEGIYTHPGHRTHIHFLLKDNTQSGHVDGISLKKGAILYLPLVGKSSNKY